MQYFNRLIFKNVKNIYNSTICFNRLTKHQLLYSKISQEQFNKLFEKP